ncbi:MarR family transcriptional regulator [Curtobacterium albidum]|uniref:MarR family transcriptional regulator n=1 Tax=Curtobacterium citreum TaxID=2036 RepID=UPI00202740E2|nr:MarR family transcriptional regulator [Curtobacterium albidum]MCL9664485.1 MarR family transcriptional regulator [Curtobacterium albidum]
MTDTSPALPPLTVTTSLPPAPVSPVVEIDVEIGVDPDVAPPALRAGTDPDDAGLARMIAAFRVLQVRHARVLAHESAAQGLGITDTRFLVHLAASEGQATTPKQAGDVLELSTGAMTSLLDRLERHGHLERRPNPGDRRSILVHLTPSGAAVARAVGAAYASAFSEAVPAAERIGVAAALEDIGAALDRRYRAATAR